MLDLLKSWSHESGFIAWSCDRVTYGRLIIMLYSVCTHIFDLYVTRAAYLCQLVRCDEFIKTLHSIKPTSYAVLFSVSVWYVECKGEAPVSM